MAKKGILAVVVLFIGFYMVSDPSGLADLADNGGGGLWSVTTDFFDATIRFLEELT